MSVKRDSDVTSRHVLIELRWAVITYFSHKRAMNYQSLSGTKVKAAVYREQNQLSLFDLLYHINKVLLQCSFVNFTKMEDHRPD